MYPMHMLAMHMANELLSNQVAAVTLVLGAGAVALAAWRAGKSLDLERLPLMGVMGAFVFAAQMINFTLPLMPGTSGHLGGGVLLAILLGPSAGIVTLASILIVQCLLFQDGGLLALGCNIINMAVVPGLLGWAIYRLVLGPARLAPAWRQYVATWLACTIGVAGGAALVPFQSTLSGVLRIPTGDFLAVMVGVHLIIGFIEGAITFAVIAYLRRARPQCLGLEGLAESGNGTIGRRALAGTILVTALLLAGLVSWFASTRPDGLEYSYQEHKYAGVEQPVASPAPTVAAVTDWQARYSPLTDYGQRQAPMGELPPQEPAQATANPPEQAGPAAWPGVSGWGSLAGLIGTAVTLGLVYLISVLLGRAQRLRVSATK